MGARVLAQPLVTSLPVVRVPVCEMSEVALPASPGGAGGDSRSALG